MAKICPTCNREWPDEFQACPLDGTSLIEKPMHSQGFNLNLGDANAISGGINLSDNHSTNHSDSHNVDSHNVSTQTTDSHNVITHNIDSHNVITNHITQIEREKSAEEKLQDKKNQFRAACQEVMQDGLVSAEARIRLNHLQSNLGIEKSIADAIFEEVRRLSAGQNRPTELGPVQKITLQSVKDAIANNDLQKIVAQMPKLQVIAEKYDVDEVQCLFYMLHSVLQTNEYIQAYTHQHEDRYWQTYWASFAYRIAGNVLCSEEVLNSEIVRWSGIYPDDNICYLAALHAIIDHNQDSLIALLNQITDAISAPLAEQVVYLVQSINEQPVPKSGQFYEQLFIALGHISDTEEDEDKEEANNNNAIEDNEKEEVKETQSEPRPANWPKFCNKCGNPLRVGQKFCNKCGNPITIKS